MPPPADPRPADLAPVAAPSPRWRRDAWLALGLPSALLLLSIGRSGLWDPYELDVAELGRRAAIHVFGATNLALPDAENRIPTLGDLGRGELPVTSIALSFRLFGLGAVAGRLPMALWGLVATTALWLWLRRAAGARVGTYAVVILATTPLFFVQARTMLGDVVTMASVVVAFAGLGVATLLPARRSRDDIAWLGAGMIGLITGFFSRGGLVGVAVPCLAVGCTWLALGPEDRTAPGRTRASIVGIAALACGSVSAALAMKGMGEATPSRFMPWLGAAVTSGQRPPTFDAVLHHLGHALFPWSALLPMFVGRVFSPPPDVVGIARERELRLRFLLVVGGALSTGAHAWLASRVGVLPFSGVGLLAALGAVALHDLERGAHPSRAVAVASSLLAVLLLEDFGRAPERALAAFGVQAASFPDAFRATSRRLLIAATALFVVLLSLALIDADATSAPHPGAPRRAAGNEPWWRRLFAFDEVRSLLSTLDAVWEGNLAFCGIMLEAALVGLGGLLFLGERLHFKVAFREGMSASTLAALINAWWALPLGALGSIFALLSLRKSFASLLDWASIPRAWVAAAAGASAGALLAFAYFPALAGQLSPRLVFDAYARLRSPGEPMGLLGVTTRAAAYEAPGARVQAFADASNALAWLVEGPERRWLALRTDDLANMNALYRSRWASVDLAPADRNLPVVDAHSGHVVLASSALGETPNENPLARFVGSTPPRPVHPLVANLEDQLEALGWDLFDATDSFPVRGALPGRTYVLRLYFRVLATPTTQWKSFIHIDGFGRRYNGDHDVFEGRYPMSLWQPGDIVTDHHEFKLEPNFSPGNYTIYYGFFVGERRLQVKSGRHHEHRIDGGPFAVL